VAGALIESAASDIVASGITSPDDLMKTALEEAADKTAEYLEQHR
jgi:hypothetical protein